MNPTTLDPCADGIRAHPCIKHIPQWPDNGPRMEALRRDMQETGLCQPVQMTARHEIVDADSRERWRAARALQLPCIPVAIIPDELAATACLHTLEHRRHLTKGARVYLEVQLRPWLEAESEHRRLESIKKSVKTPMISVETQFPSERTTRGLAERLGCSHVLVGQALRVLEIFAKDRDYKLQMESRLLLESLGGEQEQHQPIGLGAIIAGHAGKRNEDQPRHDHTQLDLFGDAVKKLCLRSLGLADNAATRRIVGEQLDKLSPEELESVQATAALVANEARARLKQLAKPH